MAFTPNQQRAITASGNTIVSAGAGSGKTTVMIARIIEKLKTEGVSLGDMLIVTYTRASAADMRVKLTEKLYELKHDPQYRDLADDALNAMPTSNIGTLHSYCQKLVRMYFFAAGLDPSAAICDEGEADAIKLRAVADAVDRAWQNKDRRFLTMYDMLCTRRSDDSVKKAVKNILEFAISMPDPQAYLGKARPDSSFFAELNAIIARRRAPILDEIAALKLDLDAAKMTKHVDAADDMTAYVNGFTDKIRDTRHTKKLDYTDLLNDRFKALKKKCVDFCAFAAEAEASKKLDSAPYVQALLDVAADAYKRYAERKRSLGKIDYSDLEHGAYRVLCDEACISEIAHSVKYVFIDEFQDVNPLQSAIVDALRAAGAEMFVVGDVKQSIYGFRRCSPEHFKRAVASDDYTHIPLTDNFRSSQEVIDFVNRAFDGVMTEDFGGVDYSDDDQRLRWGNKQILGGKAVFYAVQDDDTPRLDDVICAPGAKQNSFTGYSVVNNAAVVPDEHAEAVLVADCIVDYIKNSPLPDMGSIAVLVRSVKTPFCAALADELDRRAIKFCVGKDRAAADYPEIVALTDILRCVDNRLDDVALYTAMRSGMGGFSDEELAVISADGESACRRSGIPPMRGERIKSYAFWQKVSAYNGALKAKVDKFIDERNKIAQYALNHDCADVLGYITSEIDYFQHIYETHGSAAAVDSLIRFAADRGFDMHAFLNYYDGNKIDLVGDSGGDAVTITTVHSSKGLEYDLVILADTAKKFNEQDNTLRVIASENGVFVKLPENGTRKIVPTAPWLVENALYPERSRAEELRLLYVALTRAKRALVVTGRKKYIKPVPPKDCKRMINFLGNIPPSEASVPHLPIGDMDVEYPFDAQVAEAVAARHKQAEEYNRNRLRSVLPVKTCVTAVSHEALGDDYTSTAPILTVDDRDDGRSGNAMLRGTAYHRAMETVDFDEPDLQMLRDNCENFDMVDERDIVTAAAAMKELTLNSAFVARERYFIVSLPADLVYGDSNMSGSVLVQGVIDLLIIDKDGYATVVDYKTGNPESLHNDGYRKQLKLYSEAVERCTPYKVKKALLYSFAAATVIEP